MFVPRLNDYEDYPIKEKSFLTHLEGLYGCEIKRITKVFETEDPHQFRWVFHMKNGCKATIDDYYVGAFDFPAEKRKMRRK